MQVSRLVASLLHPVPSPSALIRSTHDQRELRRIADLLRADLPGSVAEVRERARCRAVLASNPACPLCVLARLSRDPDREVRQVAERHLYDPTPATLTTRYAH